MHSLTNPAETFQNVRKVISEIGNISVHKIENTGVLVFNMLINQNQEVSSNFGACWTANFLLYLGIKQNIMSKIVVINFDIAIKGIKE